MCGRAALKQCLRFAAGCREKYAGEIEIDHAPQSVFMRRSRHRGLMRALLTSTSRSAAAARARLDSARPPAFLDTSAWRAWARRAASISATTASAALAELA